MKNVKGQFISILGAARSGVSAARLLKQHGANVLLSDMNIDLKTRHLTNRLDSDGIMYEFGHHSDRIFESDTLVISPGIPMSLPLICDIRKKRIPICSEIEISSWFVETPIIAVTGSNGKTTTVNLIADMLNHSGRDAVVCGNTGYSFSNAVLAAEKNGTKPVFVVEISSFQLETTYSLHPDVSILLNITPDHLDRYDSFEHYAKTKCRIFNNQTPQDLAVLNSDDKIIQAHARPTAKIIEFSREKKPSLPAGFLNGKFIIEINEREFSMKQSDILLFGPHNEYNISAAAVTVLPFINNADGIFSSLKSFSGLPHRLEFCAVKNGVRFYNDSKATNTDSVRMALKGFSAPIHCILGGRDKNNNFNDLRDSLKTNDKLYVIGEAAGKIISQLPDFAPLNCGNLNRAVHEAFKAAQKGDNILLSPACASYDQYKNYEERGDHFKKIVRELTD